MSRRTRGNECRGADLNRGTTKDKVLSLAPLARLGYPCIWLIAADG